MTEINEPADRGYAAVRLSDGTLEVYRRGDELARKYGVGDAHWGCCTNGLRPALTWRELTALGQVAYVGEFVDRHVEFKGKPWASL